MKNTFSIRPSGTLYLHFPCFDGVVSGVLAWEFLERSSKWRVARICPVNYDLRENWLSTRLRTPCAIVDFLYHPQASFWADHHLTSFSHLEAETDFQRRRGLSPLWYDNGSPSCATLLWEHVAPDLGSDRRYAEMVYWAAKIDSAGYSSVEEALLGDAPALRLNFSLMCKPTQEYCEFLLKQLRVRTLEQVACRPEVRDRSEEVKSRMAAGLDRLRDSLRLEADGIAVFDTETSDDLIVSRYAPYYLFPQARYSIGITRSPKGARITAMRNPWQNFPSIALGTLFEKHGGGGHQRVGSIFLPGDQSQKACDVLTALLQELRAARGPVATKEGALA